MNRLIWYIIGLLPAVIIVIYTNAIERNVESILTSVGLLYGVLGSSLALAGDWDVLKRWFVPTRKINRIQSARDNLYDIEIIQRGDPGYDELTTIVTDEFDIDEEPDCITFGSGAGSRGINMSGKEWIRGYYKDSKFSENELDIEGSYASTLGSDNYESVRIGLIPLFDSRINHHLTEMENSNIQKALYYGWFFLMVGFVLQLISNISVIELASYVDSI